MDYEKVIAVLEKQPGLCFASLAVGSRVRCAVGALLAATGYTPAQLMDLNPELTREWQPEGGPNARALGTLYEHFGITEGDVETLICANDRHRQVTPEQRRDLVVAELREETSHAKLF